jgi:hypothetical protein
MLYLCLPGSFVAFLDHTLLNDGFIETDRLPLFDLLECISPTFLVTSYGTDDVILIRRNFQRAGRGAFTTTLGNKTSIVIITNTHDSISF